MQKLHPPKEEVARRGKAIYEAQVRSQVEPEFIGKVVAIDIDTGEFAIGESSLNAADILLERLPEAGNVLDMLPSLEKFAEIEGSIVVWS